MKQLLIISGKGGTGKTTLSGAFIHYAGAKAFADCDVDAPNLHLIKSHGRQPKKTDFYGLPKAEIDSVRCTGCSLCTRYCAFNAIEKTNGKYNVLSMACEGCGVCELVCPQGAVKMNPYVAGELMLSKENGVFSSAKLKTGSGNSGKLVSEVKKQLINESEDAELAIIDGSPGIGCPVIASLSGVDLALIVAEPSVSGISDMERIVQTALPFGINIAVCVNKHDINAQMTDRIYLFCEENGIPFTGTIPYDEQAVAAVNSGITIAETDCEAGRAAKKVFENTISLLEEV
jgi:MinD superfamily P-loop ATPase